MIYYLPDKCNFGFQGTNWKQAAKIIENSYISGEATKGNSADTSLYGSFCPKYTGLYNLKFEGKFEQQFKHVYSFITNETNDLNDEITNVKLYNGECYSVPIVSAGRELTYSKFSVTYENKISYIPSGTELITCIMVVLMEETPISIVH